MAPLPKRGFGSPPRTVRFPPPSGVSALFFLYKNPRQSRPEALLEGCKIFGRARSLVRLPPPIRFAPPHITAQLNVCSTFRLAHPAFVPLIRKALDTFNFLRHVMRAIWSVRPKCSHRCVSLKETLLKSAKILQHTAKNSTEQTAMRTKWSKTYRDLNCSEKSARP